MPRELTEAHKKAMALGRRKKARQRARAEEKRRQEQARALKATLPRLRRDYDKALARANKAQDPTEITKRFNAADQLQNAIINTSREIERLERNA